MEFVPWPSISRLNKEAIYTEKINGTNAAVVIEPYTTDTDKSKAVDVVSIDGDLYGIWAQSRKRFITPGDDNFAFALWVYDNAPALIKTLGVGRHFGEWWGKGIQGGYGLTTERRFSLFNVKRWEEQLSWTKGHILIPELYTVPVLGKSTFDTGTALYYVGQLRTQGSVASPGFMKPEGVVVFHTASQVPYKTFLENDTIPKSLQEGHK
jgi:hypothetical protein